MNKSKQGLLMVIVSSVVFGVMPAAVTLCKSYGATSALVMLARYFILGVALLPIVLRQKGTWQLYRKNLWKTGMLSVLGGGTPLLLYAAYRYLATSITTTIHFLYPTVVVLMCVLLFREKLSKRKALCLVLCCAGMLLMLDMKGQQLNMKGLLLALLSSVTWAGYIVLLDKFDMHGATKEQTLFHLEINGFVLMLLYGSAVGELQVSMPPVGWLLLLVTGLVMSVLGTLMFVFGVRQTGAQVSAIASTLEPIVSILVGVVFLREPLTLGAGIGSAMILLSVFLVSMEDA